MKKSIWACACAAAVLALGASASAQSSKPDATIEFHGGGVGFIAGVSWGGGTLHYKGQNIPLEVSGLQVGTIGASKYDARGDVFNLKQPSDIAGTYAAGTGEATVAGGVAGIQMQNGAGVVIKAAATTAGLNLKFGPSGVSIRLKK
jgi:hypothetical protein